MHDLYDSGSIFPMVVVVFIAFIVAKSLAKLGILTKENELTISKVLAVIVGIIYASVIEPSRSFGPILDFLIRIAGGAFAGVVLWGFIFFGVVGASNDVDTKNH